MSRVSICASYLDYHIAANRAGIDYRDNAIHFRADELAERHQHLMRMHYEHGTAGLVPIIGIVGWSGVDRAD